MRKIIFVSCICIVLIIINIIGCAKGFDRGVIRESMYSEEIITDDEIKRILELKPQIKFPFKLGIYFSESLYGWYRNIKWEKDEKNIMWLDQLKSDGIVSEIIPINSVTVSNDDQSFLKTVRLAAARHNTDAVLIIDYNYGVDRYNNYSAFLYLTIIGGYLVPGTHSDSLVIMNGTLWDVRNEYLYLTVEVESDAKKIGPAFILRDEDSIKLARKKALKEFKEEILGRMRNIKGLNK